MALDTMSVRTAAEHKRLIREVALALRTRPGFEAVLHTALEMPLPDDGSPPADVLRALHDLPRRLDELAARVEQVDAVQRTPAEHSSTGIAEIWQHLDAVGKRMAEFDARLTRLEMREPAGSAGAAAKRKKRTSTRQPSAPSDA